MSGNSFSITLDSSDVPTQPSDNFTIYFDVPLQFKNRAEWECALVDLRLWYVNANISSQFNNNVFYYNNGSTDRVVPIATGIYSVPDLDVFLKAAMKANGDYSAGTGPNGADEYYIQIIPNFNINRVELYVSNSYTVDLTQNDLRVWLGFNSAVYSADTVAQTNPYVNNGITNFLVQCDCIEGSVTNKSPNSVIFSYIPDVSPSKFVNLHPEDRIYLPLAISTVNKINVRVVDNFGRRVDFRGENVTVGLHFKRTTLNVNVMN